MRLGWLLSVLSLAPALCQQQCTCASTSIVQKAWSLYDVMFWGNIKMVGNTIQATVSAPIKGCLVANQQINLVIDVVCPVTLPVAAMRNSQLFLVTGVRDGANVKIDKCGWTKPYSKVDDSDALWLTNQPEQCNGNWQCRNTRTPLGCDSSSCNLNACSGAAFCEPNPCHNCALQYFTSDRKLKCGELGGQEFENRLCSKCTVDPCIGETPCQEAARNSTCISNTCFGCDRPIWVDGFGRQVCLLKSDSHQCADYGSVIFRQNTCTKPIILGYANMKNSACVPVSGCLPIPPDIDLWETAEKCRKECMCLDFANVDMKYDASDNACNQNLGWALVSSQCSIVRGCTAMKNASPVSSSLYATESICKSACVGKLKSFPTVNGRPADWKEEANGGKVQPQYSKVFPRNTVNRMDFKFEPADWQAMQADLQAVMNAYANSAGQSGALGRRLLSEDEEEEIEAEAVVPNAEDEKLQAILSEILKADNSNVLKHSAIAETTAVRDTFEEEEEAYYRERRSARRNLISKEDNMPSRRAGPSPAPMSSADAAAMDRAMAQIFKGDALPDGSCRPACGSGGFCPARRDSSAGVKFGFNERGVVLSREPESFPVTLTAQGNTWRNVGIRFKGGSSLTGAYFMQSQMLPFRIKLDESTKELPETKDQKFYGFSKLSFSNNWMEKSHIREVLSYEILGASGIKSPRATPVRIYFDFGDGPVFWGLYTMIEDPTDTVVMNFPDDRNSGKGNLYKPENNTWDKFVVVDFEKKSNEKQANFSDIQAAFIALHAPSRLLSPSVWRANLEQVFDVVTFLKVLAAVSIIGNWDTYGLMPHNYYLYNLNDRLTWMPWDFNLALACDDRTTSIFKNEIGDEWPLVSFTMADAYYRGVYTSFVQWLITQGPFVAKDLIKRKDQLIALVTPHVMGKQFQYEAEEAPHTVMYQPWTFPLESQKLDVYINQRASIAQRELEAEAQRLRLGR